MTIINDKKNIFYADKLIIGTDHSSSSGGIMFCSTNQTGGSTRHCRIYGFSRYDRKYGAGILDR